MSFKMRIESLLEKADEALSKSKIVIDNKDVYKEYEGYIAGFGATVVNIGIKAAICYYYKDHEALNKEAKNKPLPKAYRTKVLEALAWTIGEESNAKELIKSVKGTNAELYDWTQRLVDASVALKIMVRTYKFKENDSKQ